MNEVNIGDRVWASGSPEFDPKAFNCVGIVVGWIKDEQGVKHYLIGEKLGKPAWHNFGIPNVRKVSESTARRIVRLLRRVRRKPLFDQIWEVLIEEHRKGKS